MASLVRMVFKILMSLQTLRGKIVGLISNVCHVHRRGVGRLVCCIWICYLWNPLVFSRCYILDTLMFLIPSMCGHPSCNKEGCTLSPFLLPLFVLERVENSAWAASRPQSHGLEGAEAAGTPPAWSRQSETWHFRRRWNFSRAVSSHKAWSCLQAAQNQF